MISNNSDKGKLFTYDWTFSSIVGVKEHEEQIKNPAYGDTEPLKECG